MPLHSRLLALENALISEVPETGPHQSLWRNWLARSAVNRKDGGSSPPRDGRVLGYRVSEQ